jgi:short-chain fatty acids transporter
MPRFARAVAVWVPDATAAALIMIVALAVAALALGDSVTATIDGFYRGLWMLLPFSMQMTLVLLLSAIVGSTPLLRRSVAALAAMPRTALQVVILAVLLPAVLGYFYWGLGLALGPMITVHLCRAAAKRGLVIDFPALLATTFAASSVWQFGLSSSAALLVATPGHFLESQLGVVPLGRTIGSTAALAFCGVFVVTLIALARALLPREPRGLDRYPSALQLAEAPPVGPTSEGDAALGAPGGFARWTEQSALFPRALAGLMLIWLHHHFVTKGASLDLNAMVTLLLMLALLLQPNLAAFSRGLRDAVATCWQILVLYQIYAGVAGLLQFTSVGKALATSLADLATPATFPLLTAIAGTLVALFVPSSGGQWVIQGFVTTESAVGVGASPVTGLLALGIGDQMGNLLSPFWIVVAAGIARIDFRVLYGYCLIYAGLWFVTGVAVFTLVRA